MTDVPEAGLYRYLDEMQPWRDDLQSLEVVAIADEAPNVKTFTFRSDNQTWFRYRPGQFITLELPCEPEPLLRTYTLASSPSRPFSIAVTVKMQPDSVGTRWMFEALRPGMHLNAFGPSGTFSLHDNPAAKYLFVSAGSGITPMMSMLRWLNDCAPWTDVAFINCARRPEDIIFRRELELLGYRMPNLSLDFLVTERSGAEKSFGHRGRIDAVRLPLLVPDFREREVFCCGPEPFMTDMREMLVAGGLDPQHFHRESFAAPKASAVEAAIENAASVVDTPGVPVSFVTSGVTWECPDGQTILQASRLAGVRIPAACELGLCGTCKVRKLSGVVAMNHNGGILDQEIEEGFILACCSLPQGPVEIDV